MAEAVGLWPRGCMTSSEVDSFLIVISFGNSISELKNSSFCCISEDSSSASVASMGDLKAEVPLSTNSDFSGVF